eukprot:COSAG01_NODE_25966_length_727_cov_1.808917_2_plen_126_part_00
MIHLIHSSFLAALAWLPGCLLIVLVVEWLMAMWPWSVVCSALLRQPTFASDGNVLAPTTPDVEAGSSAAAKEEEGGLAQSSSVEQQVTTAARESAAVQRLKAHGTAEQLGGGGPPGVFSIRCGPF